MEVFIQFLGLSDEKSLYKNAKVAVLPVPYEATVSFGKGTKGGPAAIIDASVEVERYDEELECEPHEVGIATLPPLEVDGVSPGDVSQIIMPAVSRLLADGKWPLILGGEHTITSPIVMAFHEVYPDLTVVQFDAHADLRPEYMGTPMSHACAMARVREICPAVQVGIRNISKGEADAAREGNYPIIYAGEIHRDDSWMERALASIKTEHIYITIDVDAFDASILPATGTPEPGGMNWYQVTRFLRMLNEGRDVIGVDLVELAPIKGLHAYDFLVAKLAYKCIGYRISSGREKTR